MTYLAVIDVETTGLNPYRHDRVIELAALMMRLDGEVIREFVTLLNPERDIGPTSIHGLTASDIIAAPRFPEVAGALLDILNGCVALAGHQVASLLGFHGSDLDELLEMASQKMLQEPTEDKSTLKPLRREQLTGKRVCFTGECQYRHLGQTITREMATELATNRGMIVVESVTKKLDLLVVADPLTQSGKAKKAHKYGLRIMHEAVFWKLLGVEVE